MDETRYGLRVPSLVVTTSRTKDQTLIDQARALAGALNVPYVPRRGNIERVFVDVEWAYVISAQRQEVLHQSGRSFFVHAGLFGPKTQLGAGHPLVRAVAPTGAATTIVDATLGLAQDALHLAFVTGATVLGAEVSPLLYRLTLAGLAALKDSEGQRPHGVEIAATRIRPHNMLAEELLRTLDDNSADVVYLDPMMPMPPASGPGFDLFRSFTRADAFEASFFEQALRVAPRVIVKTRGNQMGAPHAAFDFERIHRSKALAYWCLTRTAP